MSKWWLAPPLWLATVGGIYYVVIRFGSWLHWIGDQWDKVFGTHVVSTKDHELEIIKHIREQDNGRRRS